MKPLISPSVLFSLKEDNSFVLVDARSGEDVRERFRQGHLQAAVHVHLEEELSEIQDDARHGGRHPLPPPAKFARVLGRLGIIPESHVVVYDDQAGGNAAARFWWMLLAVGHQRVQVLDGGMQAALDAGWPLASGDVQPAKNDPYPVGDWQLPVADMQQVEQALKDPRKLVIDVRDAARFRGEAEPYDLIAGHMPGARNIPYARNLDPQRFFLDERKLKELYHQITKDYDPSDIIVHCGSGVTACHTLVAMAQAGMKIPALYVGSYSEWVRNDKPIAKGE